LILLFCIIFVATFTFFIVILLEVLTILFLLFLLLTFQCNLIFYLLLPAIFFIKGITQIGELHSDHQVEHKVRTKQYAHQEENVEHLGIFCVANYVHHGCPTFKRNDLEYIQHGPENVVKVEGTREWILESLAFTRDLFTGLIFQTLLIILAEEFRPFWSHLLAVNPFII
jgi:hypothetical protein